ncbi:MAG: hypothetical protein QM783_09850 [Phycisphaerales bacterium]
MNNKCLLLAALCLSPLVLNGCNSDSNGDAKQMTASGEQRTPFSVMEVAELSVVSQVQAIDYSTRRVTLVDKCGATMTFTASDEVKHLNEIKAGDKVKIECGVAVLAEVREATADEKANPVATIGTGQGAGAGSAPSVTKGRSLRVVTTVKEIDDQAMRITLAGPRGDSTTFKAKKPENVKRLRVGDTVVLTYSEGVAATVVPAAE